MTKKESQEIKNMMQTIADDILNQVPVLEGEEDEE